MHVPTPAGLSLFAQEAVSVQLGSTATAANLFGIMLAIFIPISIIALPAIVLGLRHARRERELEHDERLKALEMGLVLPQDAPFWSPNNTCIALGVVMPTVLFVLALVSTQRNPGLMPYVWPIVGVIGGLGIIGGTLLALILPKITPRPVPSRDGLGKRHVDPDTYDTAGRRGWDAAAAHDPSHA